MSDKKSISDALKEEARKQAQQNTLAIEKPKLSTPQYIKGYPHESLFGWGYRRVNTLNHPQKQTILRYLFSKNNLLEDELLAYEKNRLARSARKQTAKLQIQEKQHLQKLNTFQLVQGLAENRNRLGVLGYCWGAFIGCIAYTTVLQRVSMIRRVAGFVTIFHLSGVMMNFANCDRFIDKMYPLFQQDLEDFEAQQLVLKKVAGQANQDQFDIKNADKRLQEFFKETSQKDDTNVIERWIKQILKPLE